MQKAECRRQNAEGRMQKAEGRRQKAEGRGATALRGFPPLKQVAWQKAEGRRKFGYTLNLPVVKD
jgi:hypothetical protein